MDIGKSFRVEPDKHIDLSARDPGDTLGLHGKAEVEAQVEADRTRLAELQLRLHVEGKRALLICLQGCDASGKDGVVTHLFRAMNPMGGRAVSFKAPSAQEMAHDFLWRYHAAAPARGEIAIFNRTHYESVLIERVHKLVPHDIWMARYGHIRDFERLLNESGTTVVKFFLHISADEQLARFKARLDDPEKRWKISEADYKERESWADYTQAYSDMLGRTSTLEAPWHVIPANHKWFRDFAVFRVIADTLLGLALPAPEPHVDLDAIRRKYHAARREAVRNEHKVR